VLGGVGETRARPSSSAPTDERTLSTKTLKGRAHQKRGLNKKMTIEDTILGYFKEHPNEDILPEEVEEEFGLELKQATRILRTLAENKNITKDGDVYCFRPQAPPPKQKLARVKPDMKKVLEMLDDGKTKNNIAREFGVHPTTVDNWLKKHERTNKGQRAAKKNAATEENVKDGCVEDTCVITVEGAGMHLTTTTPIAEAKDLIVYLMTPPEVA